VGQGPAQVPQLGQRGGDARAKALDERGHRCAGSGAVGVAVRGDQPLIDPPGGFDLHVLGVSEQDHEPLALAVGEQGLAGVQGPPGPVQRVAGQAAVTV
jgi:hypothetical protein